MCIADVSLFVRVHDTAKWNQPELIDFEPKKMEDYDVDIKIEYCGICGSDVSSIISSSFAKYLRTSLYLAAYHNGRMGRKCHAGTLAMSISLCVD